MSIDDVLRILEVIQGNLEELRSILDAVPENVSEGLRVILEGHRVSGLITAVLLAFAGYFASFALLRRAGELLVTLASTASDLPQILKDQLALLEHMKREASEGYDRLEWPLRNLP